MIMKEKKLLINAFFVLIIVMLLPGFRAEAEEKYTYKDYSAVMEVVRDTNLRTEPSLDGEVVGAYEKGTKIEVTGVCNETGWYRVLIDDEIRYMTNKNLRFVSIIYTFESKYGTGTMIKNTNIRSEPSTDGKILGEFKTGEEIVITGVCNENGWYRTLYNGNICYVTDKNVKIGYRGLKETSKSESASGEESKVSSEAALINTEKTTKSTNSADSDTVTSQDLLNIFLVIMLFCGVLFVIFKSEKIHTPDTFVPESKPKKKKPDNSIFGIDWDGDGEVDFADDYITMDLLEDDEF